MSALLLPDVGTAPVASYRPLLRRLLELRQARPEATEPLLVIATSDPGGSGARAEAWRNLLRRVAAYAGEPLRARILARAEIPYSPGRTSQRPTTVDASQLDEVLGLVARHPLLARAQLAVLLGTSQARVALLHAKLLKRGWLRQIDASDAPPGAAGLLQGDLSRLHLVELTRSGVREASRWLLLPGHQAARHHGMLGSHARGRKRMLRHLAHTIGANAVFTALAQAARVVTKGGGDDALLEWRSASACARAGCRPDGFGCYRRGQTRYGFFLEYDRGTERAREYVAKLEAYYRYRDGGGAARDYVGFPTVLVVTTIERAEERIAHQAYLASERHSRLLPLLLTTTRHIELNSEGILGPVWRAPGPLGGIVLRRGYWLPGGPPRGLIRFVSARVPLFRSEWTEA